MSYKIGEVSRLAKVSIKTLHHYDAIGLLPPTGRSDSGYRLYSGADLARLQQILFYRQLEFSLEDIHRLMTAPEFDALAALKKQKDMLEDKQEKLADVIDLIARTITSKEENSTMNLKDMFDVFPEINDGTLAETQVRWGDTEAHKESTRRAKNYSRQDWETMKAEQDAVHAKAADLFAQGVKADDPRVIAVADELRLLIDKWHYPCSKAFHVTLTEMTSSDERFVKNIDKHGPGLAGFIHAAAQANLDSE